MSNLGFQTVYRLFNAQDDVVCERVFLPPKQELAAALRRAPAAAHDLESQTPVARLRRARVLGVVRVGLHERPDAAAAGRPAAVRRGAGRPAPAGRDRRRRDVREPRAAGAVCRRDRRRRRRSARAGARRRASRAAAGRDELLDRLAGERGFYVPSLYDVRLRHRRHDRGLRSRRPAIGRRRAGAQGRAAGDRRRSIRPPRSIFTPDTEFGSRFLVEVVRGCANLCRFCWAGYNYLPVRAVPGRPHPATWPRRRAPHANRVGLVSIALCDHPGDRADPRRPARDGLLDQPGVAAARRPDRADRAAAARRAASASITIAPETGSDRLRRVINKTVTNDEILDRADLIFASGIENLKLYFMIGLPTETDDDLVAIRDLTLADARPDADARAGRAGTLGRIVGSVNPLIPKPGTAYQWLPMEAPAVDRAQDHAAARADRRHRQRATSTSSPSGTRYYQALLSLGDRRVAPRHRGRRAQRRPLARGGGRGRRRRRLLRLPRPHRGDAVLPWDIIDGGMKAAFFRAEFEKGLREEWTLPPKRAAENIRLLPIVP